MTGARTNAATDPACYLDAGGRTWSTAKLDALLAQPAVMKVVRQGISICLGPRGDVLPGTAYCWAVKQHRRSECVNLLVLLMVRLRDREARDAA